MKNLEKLQTMINESGLSRYFISNKTGLSQAALSKIMRDKIKEPHISTSIVLKKFFFDFKKRKA